MKAAFHNLGCKVNQYELDAMEKILLENGFEIVPFSQKADVYVINTCTVTNIADRKSRQMLHKAKKNNPDSIIVATGCYVQTEDNCILEANGIDLCIGNNHKGELGEILLAYLETHLPKIVKDDMTFETSYEALRIEKTSEHTRAFIKIQDGCNQFCSYCMIPYARGRVRSREPEDVLAEIKLLADKGYKEFVVTGIHLSSYGTDFIYDDIKADRFRPNFLLELLERIAALEKVERIRLGSLEPRIANEEFVKRLSKIEKVCPHFHLSLQSGCESVLKRMNRHYTKAEFMQNVDTIRKYYEHPAITTDVIVGFPGETDEEFEESRDFCRDVNFYEMHIFKFSRRKGTPADRMKSQLTDRIKSERSDSLEEIAKKSSEEFRGFYIGKEVEVLFEEPKLIEGKNCYVGHTKEYVKVFVETDENLTNELRMVKILDGKELMKGLLV